MGERNLFAKSEKYLDEIKEFYSLAIVDSLIVGIFVLSVIIDLLAGGNMIRTVAMFGTVALYALFVLRSDSKNRINNIKILRLDFYHSLMSKYPSLSVKEIANLFGIPKIIVKRDLKRILRHSDSSNPQPQTAAEERVIAASGQSERLKELSEKISNQVLRNAIKELIQASELQCNSSKAEYLKDNYLPRIELLLERYVELSADTPDGYDNLLELISTVTETFNQIKVAEDKQAEMDFSAETLAVLQSLSMNQLTYSDFNQHE